MDPVQSLSQPSVTQTTTPAQSRGGSRRPRRAGAPNHRQMSTNASLARGNPDHSHLTSRDPSLAFLPASMAPPSQPSSTGVSSAEHSGAENPNSKSTRGGANRRGRSARGGRRGNISAVGREQVPTAAVLANQNHDPRATHTLSTITTAGSAIPSRQFGGRLTAANAPPNAVEDGPSSLSAEAADFQPGQQQHKSRSQRGRGNKTAPRPLPGPRSPYNRQRRDSALKSTAPDIATRTHEDIANSLYECPICTSEIGRNSKVWSCKTCWTVFHLTCIKKWSINEGSTHTQQRNSEGEDLSPRQWRCPGCNLPKDVLPSSYACWCEKEIDPRPISGIPPHSCGQTCGHYRALPKKCPHPCELPCHAGPCPPCTHKGPTLSCFCGKHSASSRCVDTDYEAGWSCGQICGDLMPCGLHTCQQLCHEGLCGACEVSMDSRCYCGKVAKPLSCCDRRDEKASTKAADDSGLLKDWIGTFTCGQICQRDYDCGKHRCERDCHPQNEKSAHCPQSPDVVSHCPCGKTPLEEVSTVQRASCTEYIPNCNKQCLKQLNCGHPCQGICHSGDCAPCLMTVPITCRCGRVQTSTICHQGHEKQPQCTRHCKATLNCGRHECGDRCCSGERKAFDRQAVKRKLRPLGAPRLLDSEIEAEHICTRSCGRPLKCGNHACLELCHKGPCGNCREAIFEEISCHCGKTVLEPPSACGTKAPPCRFDCDRPKLCGHPQISHNCHGNEVSCPKCPYLLEKPCMCGKKLLKNQPCWLMDARCGEICGRRLKCGSHTCRRQCHRPGECEDAGMACQQACGKPKKACSHPCEERCHAPSACKEDKACQNKIFITCECQHLKQEMKCSTSKTSEGNGQKSLSCDDECARLERNRKLALALNIDPEAHKDDHVPYSAETLRMFRDHVKWGQEQEREFRVFAADEAEKRLRFKPMAPQQRTFLHSLAEDFGLDSESMDPEPHRHVAVFKTPRFVMAPMKTLAECVRIRLNAEAAAASIIEEQRRLRSNNEAYNAFLLVHPRFGLTIDELRLELPAQVQSTPGLAFDISFLPSEEIVVKARPATASTNIAPTSIEAAVKALKTPVANVIASKRLASSCQLCTLDPSLNILRKELDRSVNVDGWSQVAAKAAPPRTASKLMGVGEKSVYTVLGSKLKDAKKKKQEMEKAREEEPLIDDWEEAMRKEEQQEMVAREGKECGLSIVDATMGQGDMTTGE
ncbi:MAG: hypothetical protein Q9203_002248 [Teloschistes exilis]